MIDTAVVMLVVFDRLPWVALLILLRDLLLIGGYKLVVPRGYEFEVSRLGKIATWGLYASIGSSSSRRRERGGRSRASGSASRSP